MVAVKQLLVKLILGFYKPTMGTLMYGDNSLSFLVMGAWRRDCGVVMQDGFIFSDTIANNIAPALNILIKTDLAKAVDIANI